MCWPRVGEANPLFSVCIALWRPTALAKIYNAVGRQRNLGTNACWNLGQIHVCQCDARIACTVLPLVAPITLDCLLSWSDYLITTYTTFTFHDKWIMLSCQNQVLYITSIRASPSYCYQSLNFSKFFCFCFSQYLGLCFFLLYYQ